MENEILTTQEPQTEVVAEPVTETAPAAEEKQPESQGFGLRFFRNCSASLKRFSVLIFVINLFVAIGITGALTVVLAINLGVEMLSLLALPIVTLLVILIVLARFASALIYGFAEIVEKSEKN